MNMAEPEGAFPIVTKTCGCREKNKRKMTYQFIDSYHSLCLDKKDIIYASDEGDKRTVESEIAELKMALDLLTWPNPIICILL